MAAFFFHINYLLRYEITLLYIGTQQQQQNDLKSVSIEAERKGLPLLSFLKASADTRKDMADRQGVLIKI